MPNSMYYNFLYYSVHYDPDASNWYPEVFDRNGVQQDGYDEEFTGATVDEVADIMRQYVNIRPDPVVIMG